MSTRQDVHHDIVDSLATIGLESVTAAADLQTRRDRKYLVAPSVASAVVNSLRRQLRVLSIDGTTRFRYESVYFDTDALECYLAAARRRPRRIKVRTRSYLDSGDCVLELKKRDGRGHTVKYRHPYDLAWRSELTELGNRFIASVGPLATVDRLHATLTTAYQRTTLVVGDASARATVDFDVWFTGTDGSRARIPDVALIETKTLGPPCAFDRALWRAGQRPVVISKYCTGLAALHPHLPANKWNRVLRRHVVRLPCEARRIAQLR